MSLLNKYLVETPLTSTKNKFLKEDTFVYELGDWEPEWYKENVVLKKNLKRRLITSDVCLTNRFLIEDVSQERKKKKKKFAVKKTNIKKYCYRSMPKNRIQATCAMSNLPDSVAFAPCGDLSDDGNMLLEACRDSVCEELREGLAPNSDYADQSISKFGSSPAQCSLLFGRATPATIVTCPTVKSAAPGPLFARAAPGFPFGSAAPGLSFGSAAPGLSFGSAAPGFSFGSATPAPVEKIISKMPIYELDVVKLHEETEYEIISSHPDDSSLSENSFANRKGKKMQLLNIVSIALMYSSNLKNKDDEYRLILQKSADAVRLIDPEFILKVALYARQELQIRTVTNFLLAYAGLYQNTRIYLEKYYDASIVLPSDWIQVAEFYQILNIEGLEQPIPAALRRIMKRTFTKFDKYQLAKYNKNKIKKKKANKEKQDSSEDSDSSDDDELSKGLRKERKLEKAISMKLTLKQLIRYLHISSPTEHVMCLLGKKYPKTHEEFQSCGLPGTWDPTKAGTRMKLPIPETWETQISLHGNKAEVWESLIDNHKLPYMATLRNLKNLILSGISLAHHTKVMEYLQNKKAVMNSRQLPMQYFEAYRAITNLEVEKSLEEDVPIPSQENRSQRIPAWKEAMYKKTKERIKNASLSIIKQYKSSIAKALEISSMNNLHPIPGKTLIICVIDDNERFKNSSIKMKAYETCIMTGLMCLKACEDCQMNIVSFLDSPDVISLNENDQLLDVMMKTCEKYKKVLSDAEGHHIEDSMDILVPTLKNVLDYYLKPHVALSLKLDHVVYLQTSHSDLSFNFKSFVTSFLHKYRQIVNSELLYTNVNYARSNKDTSFMEENSSDKDVYLCGSSSSLIRFIAERSSGGQLTCVENIDIKYDLKTSDLKKYNSNLVSASVESDSTDLCDKSVSVSLDSKLPKWHTVRIFISSTFKDMMSERDLLVRYVFPELRRRAASVFIRIVEIDLRWGITESDSSTQRAAEICVTEAQRADLFVGLIGERYGTINNLESADSSDLQWVKDLPTGLSITELEVHAAALRTPTTSQKKAFFYFRDNSFARHVPEKWATHFLSEGFDSNMKVQALKNKIRSHNFKLLDGYPCHFAGIFENKPVLGGLDILGNRILEDLWIAVQEIHKTDPYWDAISEEELYQQNLIELLDFFIETKNSPMKKMIHQIKSEHGIFVICGASGSGKTAFIIKLLESLKMQIIVKFFIGISPRSRDLSYMLQYICRSICQQLGILIPIPNLTMDIVNQFSDFLLEAANCCGGRDLILLIDGLDHLEDDDQRLDWLPLFLPNRVKLVCSVSESSQAFKVLCERQEHGNTIFIEELPLLLQSDREQFIRQYLLSYRKKLGEDAFNNHMLKIVTKKDSCNPFYLGIVCDFLRIYASFDNLVPLLQKLPSSTILLIQEVILQMENEFGSTLVQTFLTLLCITKEGLEDNDLYYILSFITYTNEMKTFLPFDELKEKISLLEPENFLCQVKFCSLMNLITTFAYRHMSQKSFRLMGTEFENAVKKFYINKNFLSHSKTMHSILAAYYHNLCDVKNDGGFCGQLGIAYRSIIYHMFHGSLFKELNDLLCNLKFLEAVFRTKADDELLDYYSSFLFEVLPANQKVSREIDQFNLFAFYDFVSRNFHIFHQYPQLVMQQALNEPPESAVNVKKECNYYSLENLSRSDMLDYRVATLCGFVKNITASAGEKVKPTVILGSEDGCLKVLDLATRRVIRNIKGHSSAITCISFVGKNRICASSEDATLSLWDSNDFSRIAVLKGHRHKVTSCCSDSAGSILFSSGWDNSVRLWSLSDGRSISAIEDFRCPVNCIDHHPLKLQIACGLWNGNIEVWDTVTMQRKIVFSNFSGSVKSLAYTPDGVNIISSFIQSEISIWSSEAGLKISSLKGHILPVKSLTYSFDDSIFVSGSDDCTLKVWSTVNKSYFSMISESKFCPISLMEFITENLLAVAFQNSEIWIIDINNGHIMNTSTLSSDSVSAFSKYSFINVKYQEAKYNWWETSLVFGTNAGKIMIKEFLSSSMITKAEMTSKITSVIHNCDVIVCGTAEGDIGVFCHLNNTLSVVLYGAHKGFISSFCFSIQCKELCVLSTANDNVLKLWRMKWENFELVLQQEFINKHRDGIKCSLFYPESCDTEVLNNLLTGSHDNNIISWNGNTVKVFKGLQSSVVNIACSGDYILGCGNDGALVMWSQNGTILTSIPKIELSSATLAFFVSEDDSDKFRATLAFVDRDGSIKIRKPLQQAYCCSFDSHSKPITSCCTTENGEVISCSLDGSVSLWKVPLDNPDSHVMHSTIVTSLILSSSLEFALSSDAHGNLIVWKTQLGSSVTPLIYAGKKSYKGGFIRALSWLKNNCAVCAVTQTIGNQETYFLNIIHLNCSSIAETGIINLEVKKSYNCKSEVMCIDSCSTSDTIVVGLKSGDVMIISSKTENLVKMRDDWILGVCLYSRNKVSDYMCASFVDGTVQLFSVDELLKPDVEIFWKVDHFLRESLEYNSKFPMYEPTEAYKGSRFVTSMCTGDDVLICCGDSEGILRIYIQDSLKFLNKVHNDSISGICHIGSYLFTSSLDKTIKGWNLKTFKQVCQFHSHVPISCISSPQTGKDMSNTDSCVLLIGTTSGNVHLLKFHCQ